ncbi:hypothetical protein D3C79_739090 [compost metagenome]
MVFFPGEFPQPHRPGHHVEIVAVVTGQRRHRVVTAGHFDHVTVIHRHALIEFAIVGIDSLQAKALFRLNAVIVGFFQIGFIRRILLVVLVAGV